MIIWSSIIKRKKGTRTRKYAGFTVKQLLPRYFTCKPNLKIQAHKLFKIYSKTFLCNGITEEQKNGIMEEQKNERTDICKPEYPLFSKARYNYISSVKFLNYCLFIISPKRC